MIFLYLLRSSYRYYKCARANIIEILLLFKSTMQLFTAPRKLQLSRYFPNKAIITLSSHGSYLDIRELPSSVNMMQAGEIATFLSSLLQTTK